MEGRFPRVFPADSSSTCSRLMAYMKTSVQHELESSRRVKFLFFFRVDVYSEAREYAALAAIKVQYCWNSLKPSLLP